MIEHYHALHRIFESISSHPLSRPFARTLRRILSWQIASRMHGGSLVVPFVDECRLLVTRGMTGATGNVYFGLHEFESMGFVLHFLRPDDCFLDVGANIGSYTVLASGVCLAQTLAFEPVPATFERLVDNIWLNRITDRVTPCLMGVGAQEGRILFTATLDTMNHVAMEGECAETIDVAVTTLDLAAAGRMPIAIKMDVEGYECAVLEGASSLLASNHLCAVIAETSSLASRFGSSTKDVSAQLAMHSFFPFAYDPIHRVFTALAAPRDGGNTLFLRDIERIRARAHSAKTFRVLDVSI